MPSLVTPLRSILNSPRIAFWDIETAPTRGWVWRNYEDNLIATDKDWYILSFAVKFSDEKKIRTFCLPDYAGYEADKECDRALVGDIWKLFNEADILVGHNGDGFDIKKANARMIMNGYNPPATYKTIDTLKIARRHFKFGSNKLNDLGQYLGVGKKIPNAGSSLWFACMAGDPKAWATLRRYNAQDVNLLEKVYYKLRPWAANHPDLTLYGGGATGCPTCASTNVQARGTQVKIASVRQRFHCQACGSWFTGAKAMPPNHRLMQAA